MASVTFILDNGNVTIGTVNWQPSPGDRPEVPASLMDGSAVGYLSFFRIRRTTINSTVNLHFTPDQIITGSGSAGDQELSDEMEMDGTITVVSADGQETLVLTGISDSTEPYSWIPSNTAEMRAFANYLAGLTDRSVSFTLNDNQATEPAQPDAPGLTVASRSSITVGFTDPDDGGSAITSRNLRYRETGETAWIPLTGQTFPYAITGLDFATEYDVQVQAVNAEGNSDWSDTATATTSANQAPTVSITTLSQVINGSSTLALAATASDSESDSLTYLWSANIGSFTDGDTLNATYNAPASIVGNQTANLSLLVTDEYGAETTRMLSLTIAAAVVPSFSNDTGTARSWIQNEVINSFIVPEASGSPTPTYSVVGSLPNGINFDPNTRVISGTPSSVGSSTITIRATNSAGMDDWTVDYSTAAALPDAAVIVSTSITSMPIALIDTYGLNEVIEFTVVYDTEVDVTGIPRFPMNFGQSPSGGPEYADYVGGNGTTEIIFEWVVAATDEDTNGIFFYGDSDSQNRGEIDLNGGSIRNAGTTIDADLTTVSRGTKSGHKVDGSLLPNDEIALSGTAIVLTPIASGSLNVDQVESISLSGVAQVLAPTTSGFLDVSRHVLISGDAQISAPTVLGRLGVSRGISLSGIAQVLAPTTSGSLGVARKISLSGMAQVSIPTASGEVNANIASVIPSKEIAFRNEYFGNLKQRVFYNIPEFYNDSEILNDLYDAIIPELQMLAEYLVTPDVRREDIDSEVQYEIDRYLSNEMGWGFERLVQQFFIIGVNQLLEDLVKLYNIRFQDDYVALRNQLLLQSSLQRTNNIFELKREFDFIGNNIINDIEVNYDMYSIQIILNDITDQQLLAIIQRQFEFIFPAHMDISFSSVNRMTLNDTPRRSLDDLIKRYIV